MHLGKDSVCPDMKPGVRRLYGNRFCPFTERVRLAIAMKSIQVENVFIQLSTGKPDWYKDINPKGSVPCLVLDDGSKITDSADIVEYADSASTFALVTDDEKERHSKLMSAHSGLHKAWHALAFDKDVNCADLIASIIESMTFYEENIVGPFCHGDDIKITDILVFPWFERLESCFTRASQDYPIANFPKIKKFIDSVSSLDKVGEITETADVHYRFTLTHQEGRPDYDIV